MNAKVLDELLPAEVASLANQSQAVDLDGDGWTALILRALDRAELQPAVQSAVLGAVNFELEEVINPEGGEATRPAGRRP